MRVSIFEIFKRKISYDKKLNIQLNGEDNAYPQRIDGLINNSVTAKRASRMMASFITGKGFSDLENKTIVNKQKNITLFQFLDDISLSIAKHRGVFVHVNYNMNFEPSSFDVLPFSHCRLGKKDDNKYNGKIRVSSQWLEKKVKKIEDFDVYNRDKKVIESQIKHAGGIKNYKGQVFYFNLDKDFDYPLATIDSVQDDCDSERQASIYKNRSLRRGFFGKTIIFTKPLIDALPDDEDYPQQLSERDETVNSIRSFLGAENTGSVLMVELDKITDTFDETLKVEKIETNINDKLFEFTEQSTSKNILIAFNNIPDILIRANDSLFGNSGEAILQAKIFYQDQIDFEKRTIELIINQLMDKNLSIIPLIA